MENELEVVNIRLVREPSLYSEQILDSPQAVVELMAKELSQYDREVFCILCIFRKNRALAPHERSAVPLGTDHCPVG